MSLDYFVVERRGYDLTQLQLQCNATFQGNSDIDGAGILISSVTFAFVTSIVAFLNAWAERPMGHGIQSWLRAERLGTRRSKDNTTPSSTQKRLWLYNFSNKMLASMCDLQQITGLGIMIATFFGIESFSLYHLNLINSYYWLSMTGLWVVGSLSSYDGFHAFSHGWHSMRQSHGIIPCLAWLVRRDVLQKILIMPSVLLGVVMQVVLFDKATNEWDSQISGHCFRDADNSSWQSTWLYVIGLCLYDIGVMLTFLPVKFSVRVHVERRLSVMERRSVSTLRSLIDQIVSPEPKWVVWRVSQPPESNAFGIQTGRLDLFNKLVCRYMLTTSLIIIMFISLVAVWSLRQALALCALADGTPLFVSIYCLSFFSWSFYDIIGNKILNQELIEDNTIWGFGQILPVVLLLAVVFYVLDACEFASHLQDDSDAESRYQHSRRVDTTLHTKSHVLSKEGKDQQPPSASTRYPCLFERPLFGLPLYQEAQQLERNKALTDLL